MKKLLIVLLAVWMAVAMVSCAGKDPRDGEAKTFSVDGLSITLTDGFREKDVDGYNKGYDSAKMGVLVLKEAFADIPGAESLTLDDYAEMVLENNQGKASEVKTSDGLTYMEYVAESSGQEYGYLVVMYRSADAFWLVQFFSKSADFNEYRPSFINWAKTVTFA